VHVREHFKRGIERRQIKKWKELSMIIYQKSSMRFLSGIELFKFECELCLAEHKQRVHTNASRNNPKAAARHRDFMNIVLKVSSNRHVGLAISSNNQ